MEDSGCEPSAESCFTRKPVLEPLLPRLIVAASNA